MGELPPSIRLDEQRAFLWHEGTRENMLLSVKYSGGTSEFAWIVPIETQPKITVEKGAPFTELRHLTQVRQESPYESDSAGSVRGERATAVTVLERKEEGPYDLAVLSATSTGGLYDWLKQNGFHVSKDARGALDYYVTRKYVFLAARIRNASQGNATIARRLEEGNIAPIHLAYQAARLTYPLKVTTGNPGESRMEIYVLGDDGRPHAPLQAQSFRLTPEGATRFKISGPPGTLVRDDEFPTLRRLIPHGGSLTKYTATLSDADRQEDLVFATL